MRTETAVGLFILVSTGIFLYMSYQIGSFRFDRVKYNTFYAYFNDISGLNKKSDVKIAGVKVGWIDAIDLVSDGHQVKATLMIGKEYQLYTDAYAMVRQEGLLGGKYLEIVPGDPALPLLPAGSMLTRPSRGPVKVDRLLQQFEDVAQNVISITKSMDEAIGGEQGSEKLRALVDNMRTSAEKFASFSTSLDSLVTRNETNIDTIVAELKNVIQDLRNEIPRLSSNVQQNLERVAAVLDRDFNRMATKFEDVGDPLRGVVQKINQGQGVLGQLVNDEQSSRDLKIALNGIRTYFDKVEKMAVVFDIHTESMAGPYQKECFRENKGYVNVRIHPSEDYFYLAGIIATQAGRLERFEEHRAWFKGDCEQLIPDQMDLTPAQQLKYAPLKRYTFRRLDKFLYNIQVGKIYGNFCFRGGLFDSTGGIAVDLDIPLTEDRMRWVSSLELYDIRGRLRNGDDRPHLKWLNRLFFTRNIYFTFGADDFISHHNKNAFFGVGLRFCDDDVKYFLSRLSIII